MEADQYKLLHTPEGVRDIYNGECERKMKLRQDLMGVLKKYGYKSIQTPSFELFDIFSKERGSVSSREMYKFIDREGNTLVLRPDMTPSIARCVAKYFKEEEMPIRLSYNGNTFINNSSHQGKLNETTQIGAELMNDGSVDADGEILAITVDCLLQAGLKEFQVEIGHADFFNGLMEEAAFDEEEIMQMKSLMESKNIFGIEELVESKDLNEDLKTLLKKLPELFGTIEHLAYAGNLVKNEKSRKALARLEEILRIVQCYGFGDYITIDLGMLSKYNYYTGIIMKAYTFGLGEPVAQGGRYDNLIGQFGKEAPAVGLVILVDQLSFALSRQKLEAPVEENGILFLYSCQTRMEAIKIANTLRGQGRMVNLILEEKEQEYDVYREFCKKRGIGYALRFLNQEQGTWFDLEKASEKTVKFEEVTELKGC